jgi:tyrosine aminotransferase
LIQAAIPKILATNKTFHDATMQQLENNTRVIVTLVDAIPGLRAIEPQGAMYVMVEILLEEFKDIRNDVDFVEKLVQEQSLLCLPGQCFKCEGAFVRLVTSSPVEILEHGIARLREFCLAHRK